ncbi:MAG: protein kinase [Myxococcales bacterium]
MSGVVEEAFKGSRRFDVLARLGTGGGGVVYRARDHQTHRVVALKLMREREDLARFRQHFESLKRLAHPNLVELYDLVEERGRVLMVMELVDGSELLAHVRSATGFDEERLRSSFRQLAQALHRLHVDRRLHRDVKPSNIRVTEEGRAVLLDLDFALPDDDESLGLADDDTMLRPAGTALYMSPEQAACGMMSAASDWYALGVVLYEALTGSLPCRGTDFEVLLAKQDGRARPPRELNAAVPVDLNDLCLELLSPAPHDRPSGPAILRRLGVNDVASSLAFGSLSRTGKPIVGRSAELARLRAAFEQSRRAPVVVRVSGQAGIGKSALCFEFLRLLAQQEPELLTLRSRCPRYPDRPHAIFAEPLLQVADALRALRGRAEPILNTDAYPVLAKAFPEAVRGFDPDRSGRIRNLPPDPHEQRFRFLEAYRELVREAADLRPLVWWFDDYHWADADSRRLLSSLLSGENAPPMLVVLSEEPSSEGTHAAEPAAREHIVLGELTRAEVTTWLDGALEGSAFKPRHIGHQLDEAPGNPLSLQERLRHLALFGALPDARMPLGQLISQRLSALTETARDLLEIVSAVHDPISLELCLRASELSRSEFVRECTFLESVGLVRRFNKAGQEFLVSVHPQFADCVDMELHGARRVEVHRRLASALLARDPSRSPGRLLRHQGESGYHTLAAQNAWLAAEQAHEALAFQRAAELFTLGASLDPAGRDEAGHRRLRRMAEALGHAGWALQAATIYREAALGANTADALHMRQRAAEHLLRGAELTEGLSAVSELLASIDVSLPATHERALWSMATRRAYLRLRGLRFRSVSEGQVSAGELRRVDVLWISGVQLSLVDVVRGGDFLTRGLSAALKTGEPQRVARALCTEAWMRGLDHDGSERSLELLETARQLCDEHPSPFLEGHLRLARGIVAFGRFRLPECSSHCRDAEQIFRERCTDVVWEITAAQVFQLVSLANTARYDEQERKLERALRDARERGDVWGVSYFRSIGAMGTMLAQDRPEEALAEVHEGSRHWASADEFHFQHWVALLAAVYIDLYMGRTSAIERIEQHWPTLKRILMLRLPFARMALHELRGRANVLAARLLDQPRRLTAAEEDARTLLRTDDEISRGFGYLTQANVAQLRGYTAQAVASLRAGIGLLESQGLDMWVFAARLALGSVWNSEEGRSIARDTERTLRQRGVKNIARWRAMLMPGF